MRHEHPSPEKRRRGPVLAAPACPSEEALRRLARGLSPEAEREALEGHLGCCQSCRRRVTALVDREAAAAAPRRRRFPWVPAVATATVLLASAIAYVLGGGTVVPVAADGWVVGWRGAVRVRAPGSAAWAVPQPAQPVGAGSRVRAGKGALFLLSTAGDLYRYDARGETRLAHFGGGVSLLPARRRAAALRALAAESGAARGVEAIAPRGNILSRRPTFRLAGVKADQEVVLEIREEVPRVRIRWRGRGPVQPFPRTARPLERGRTFYWRIHGLAVEQAFYVASAGEVRAFAAFRETLRRSGLPRWGRLLLECRYLAGRGYVVDAWERARALTAAVPEAEYAWGEAAWVIEQLGGARAAPPEWLAAFAARPGS